jgi:hypothetical protein
LKSPEQRLKAAFHTFFVTVHGAGEQKKRYASVGEHIEGTQK